MRSEYIQKLEEIVPKLVGAPPGNGYKTFNLEDGRDCHVFSVFEDRDLVNVVHSFMPIGSTFPAHQHNEYEIIIPYDGILSYCGSEYGAGTSICIEPKTPHKITAVTDCSLVAVTVPASPGFPHER